MMDFADLEGISRGSEAQTRRYVGAATAGVVFIKGGKGLFGSYPIRETVDA